MGLSVFGSPLLKMFDYHLHTKVSYDSENQPEDMVQAALKAGLKEICFTDHRDYDPLDPDRQIRFTTEDYAAAYDHLQADGLKIRRGFEFGMLRDNAEQLRKDVQQRDYDFVIGSVHFVDNLDPYFDPFWQGKTMDGAETMYLEHILECVQAHENFDVLGHLTYLSKAWANPTHRPIEYKKYREIVDEILKVLAQKGKGIECNTSGLDPCGVFLPSEDYLRRFKELGGEIVTVGSDAHTVDRVGQYTHEACKVVCDIFGYVCTFEDRKPIFHKV